MLAEGHICICVWCICYVLINLLLLLYTLVTLPMMVYKISYWVVLKGSITYTST